MKNMKSRLVLVALVTLVALTFVLTAFAETAHNPESIPAKEPPVKDELVAPEMEYESESQDFCDTDVDDSECENPVPTKGPILTPEPTMLPSPVPTTIPTPVQTEPPTLLPTECPTAGQPCEPECDDEIDLGAPSYEESDSNLGYTEGLIVFNGWPYDATWISTDSDFIFKDARPGEVFDAITRKEFGVEYIRAVPEGDCTLGLLTIMDDGAIIDSIIVVANYADTFDENGDVECRTWTFYALFK